MKILVVSQYFWPENFRVNDLVADLTNRGHDVTVLTGKPNYPEGFIYDEFNKEPEKFRSYNGAPVIRVPLIARGNGGRIRLIANYLSFAFLASILGPLKLVGKKFDVIFVFEPSPVTVGLPAIMLKYVKKAPVVFWALDLWPETLEAIGVVKSKSIIKLIGLLVSFIYNRCDLLLAQSRSFIGYMQRYCKDPDKIRYFPSWAEDSFSNANAPVANEIPVAAIDTFSVMFAGNIGDAQDFPSILNAVEILKNNENIRWLIVGDGRVAEWAMNESQRRGLADRILFLGSYPIDRMPSFYESADVLLVTLKNEEIFAMTIPGKVQSYLASAKPIIGMLNGVGADVIYESGSGYVSDAGNAKGLAENVLKMSLLSREKRKKLGESGRSYYKKEFDREILIGRLESLLTSTINSRNN